MVVFPPIPGSQLPPTPEPTPDIDMTLVAVPPRAGNAAIAGALKACLDILSDMCCAEALEDEWPLLQTKLDVERTLLLQWVDKVKLLDEIYDVGLDNLDTHSQIIHLLHTVYEMLMDKLGLMSRYYIMHHEQEDSLPDATYLQSSPILSRERLEKFNSEFTRQKLRVLHVPDGTPSTTRILRIVTCKDGFERFIEDIRHLVNSLNRLASSPNCLECAAQMAGDDVKKCKTMNDLRKVRDAAKGVRDTIALSAEELIVRLARRRILANLRFDGLNERKIILQDPHPGTFEWALKAPEPDTEWDNLVEWLESGSGIYWVCGKAGAGKSTFLKYILNHPETKRRLSTWAGDEPVSLGSYFFWKLGKAQQRTRDGLARTVLYHILRRIPTLMPLLVPNMWHCSYTGCLFEPHESLPLPSVTEVREAFEKMAEPGVLDRKFCFMVDALDEYSGDGERAVAFLRRLSQIPKIKVLASSRPSPVFVDAFANSPKLHLHDLAVGDVLQYIQDKADTHRYMRALREVDETLALILVETLAEKAGGAFLWTVLATKVLLQGFDGCERFVDLEKRIANIPEELEDLFVHMLNLVEPCHREQAAKLLRMCYRSKTSRSREAERGRVWTMGVASADEDMDFDHFELHSERTLKARHRQCLALEHRLASRCGGLLEVTGKEMEDIADNKCFCATPESHPNHEIMIDSSIEFVHRTVYEWFGGLDSWALSQLELQDNGFNEDAAVASLSWQQCRLAQELGTPFLRADVNLANCMHYVGRPDKFSPKFADSMMHKILDLVAETRRKRGINWHYTFCCSPERDESGRLETLYFAVAMGMVNFVRYYMKQNPTPTLSEMETRYKMRWWKVVADRSLIRSFLEPFYETIQYLPPQGPMMLYLESSGCGVPGDQMRYYIKGLPGDRYGSMVLAANPI